MQSFRLPFLCLGLLFSLPASALTWGELDDELNAVQSGAAASQEIIDRFAEIAEMLAAYTIALREAGGSPLLCPAPGTPMGFNELIAVVKEEAQRSDAKRSATVQSLMLAGLREKFPC